MSGSGTSSSSISASSGSGAVIPVGWEWMLNICSAARFPELGMPAQWAKTAKVHEKILIDPNDGRVFNPVTGKTLSSAVGFIKATKGADPMPGSDAPAAARVALYNAPEMQKSALLDSDAQHLVPCIAHGDYVKVESLQVDHMQAKENIRKRQDDLIRMLNDKPDFAEYLLKQQGMNKFFVKHTDGKYYSTLLFYEVYFNDIDNLWLICGACNLHKSDQDTLAWLKDQWLYGQEFLDYLGKLKLKPNGEGILKKTQNEQGLAEVAIAWFWKRHANYISTAKSLLENLTIPLQILNKKVDHIIGYGRQERAMRLQDSLNARILLAGSLVRAPIGMPKGDNESSHSSSDEGLRISPLKDDHGNPLQISRDDYIQAAQETASAAPGLIKERLKQELRNKKTTAPPTTPKGQKKAKR